MMRGSVTSLVRTWPSTIMRRAVAKSIIFRIPPACERRLLAASDGKRQGAKGWWCSQFKRDGADRAAKLRSFPRQRESRSESWSPQRGPPRGDERRACPAENVAIAAPAERLPAGSRSCIAALAKRAADHYFGSDLGAPQGPRGGVVTQRSAKPCTPVQFRAWPPHQSMGLGRALRRQSQRSNKDDQPARR